MSRLLNRSQVASWHMEWTGGTRPGHVRTADDGQQQEPPKLEMRERRHGTADGLLCCLCFCMSLFVEWCPFPSNESGARARPPALLFCLSLVHLLRTRTKESTFFLFVPFGRGRSVMDRRRCYPERERNNKIPNTNDALCISKSFWKLCFFFFFFFFLLLSLFFWKNKAECGCSAMSAAILGVELSWILSTARAFLGVGGCMGARTLRKNVSSELHWAPPPRPP